MAFDMSIITNMAMGAGGVLAWVIIGGVGILLLFLVVKLWIRYKTFEYEVRVKVEEPLGSGNVIEKKLDRGGIFLDKKTQNRMFILQKTKVGMTPDNIPYYINGKGKKIVEVIQLGLKSFRYLSKPKFVSNSPIAMEYNIQDQDIAFALNVIDTAKMYKKTTLWQNLAPFVGMAFCFALFVVGMYFILKNIGVLADVANAFKGAAIEFAKAKTGTVVIGG